MKEKTETLYRKKGQVQEATNAMITLVVGIGVVVLLIIFLGALTGQTWTLIEPTVAELTTTVTDQTLTVLNSTAVSFGRDNVVNASITAFNGSNSVPASKFFYDFGTRPNTVTLLDNNFNNTALNFSYVDGNPAIKSSIENSVISAFESFKLTADYVPIIALAVVIFLVLALIIGLGLLTGDIGGGSGKSRGSSVL